MSDEMRKMRSRVRSFPIGRSNEEQQAPGAPGQSKALPEDPFSSAYAGGMILEPPVNPEYLARCPQYSDTLGACVSAMTQNIDGFGHQYVARTGRKPSTEDEIREAAVQKYRLEKFFDYASYDMSFVRMRKNRRADMEVIGRGGLEIIRAVPDDEHAEGEIQGFNHIRGVFIRFCREDVNPVLAECWRFNRESNSWEQVEYYRRFRKYVHRVGGQDRYFKEFGDPRLLDSRSGKYHMDAAGKEYADRKDLTSDQIKDLANELWVETIYDPAEVQGNPRWLGAEIALIIKRFAQESNQDYLQNGGVPLALLLIAGGLLTNDTAIELEQKLREAKTNHPENRLITVEVLADKESGGPLDGQGSQRPSISVEKMNDLQRGDDSMFLALKNQSDDDVRRPFRLNSLFLGSTGDQVYASANVGLQMGESQVFAPEREDFDWFMNNRILPELGITWWMFKSNGPTLEDNEMWMRLVEIAINSGAIPDYETLRAIVSPILGYDLPTGGREGVAAEWEKMPPAFVKQLLMVVQGFPAFSDLESALSSVVPADSIPADGGDPVATHSQMSGLPRAQLSGAAADRKVAREVLSIMALARKMATAEPEGEN